MLRTLFFAVALLPVALAANAATMQVDIRGALTGSFPGGPDTGDDPFLDFTWNFTYDSVSGAFQGSDFKFEGITQDAFANGAGQATIGAYYAGMDYTSVTYSTSIETVWPGFTQVTSFVLTVFDALDQNAFLTGLDASYSVLGLGNTGSNALPALFGSYITYTNITSGVMAGTTIEYYERSILGAQVTVSNLTPVPLPASGLMLLGALAFLRRRKG